MGLNIDYPRERLYPDEDVRTVVVSPDARVSSAVLTLYGVTVLVFIELCRTTRRTGLSLGQPYVSWLRELFLSYTQTLNPLVRLRLAHRCDQVRQSVTELRCDNGFHRVGHGARMPAFVDSKQDGTTKFIDSASSGVPTFGTAMLEPCDASRSTNLGSGGSGSRFNLSSCFDRPANTLKSQSCNTCR